MVAGFAALTTGFAGADTVYSTATFGPTTGSTYNLQLATFNPSLGTLTGVELFFQAVENVTDFTVMNTGSSPQTFSLTVTTDLTNTFVNSATAADKFTAASQNLTVFDTGGTTILALGSCKEDPTTTVPLSCAGAQTLAGGASTEYAPLTVNNTNPNYSGANNPDFAVPPVGTGLGGVTGVTKTGTSIGNYVGGTGFFTLSGTTLGGTTFSTTGTNNETLSQTTTTTYEAEVDYTYTPFSSTPEPATMVLFGSALVGLGFIRRRQKKV